MKKGGIDEMASIGIFILTGKLLEIPWYAPVEYMVR